MTPKREEFLLDVRRAVRLARQATVTTDSELVSPEVVSRALHRAALWLTPKVVESYEPMEFQEWPVELKEALNRSVECFRAVAATVPADAPATGDQFAKGEAVFQGLVRAVRDVVLWDWRNATEDLIRMTEAWAHEVGWVTRRESKQLSETLLDGYTLPQMLMHAAPYLYVLDPVARFVTGAAGAFDLSIQPSYYLTSLYRTFDGTWYAHFDLEPGVDSGRREPWNRETFTECVEGLRALV